MATNWWQLKDPVTLSSFGNFPFNKQVYSVGSPAQYSLPSQVTWNAITYPVGTLFDWIEVAEPSNKGWYVTQDHGDTSGICDNIVMANPRGYQEITALTNGSAFYLLGAPGISCVIDNKIIYAAGGYTVGTDAPSIRIFDGKTDTLLCSFNNTTAGTVPKCVMSVCAGGDGYVYCSTLDGGTSKTDWTGHVYRVNPLTGASAALGNDVWKGTSTAPNMALPYALCWANGRIWVGCIYFTGGVEYTTVCSMDPMLDTTWRQMTVTVGGVAQHDRILSMAFYKGKIYLGTTGFTGAAPHVYAEVPGSHTANAFTATASATAAVSTADFTGFHAMAVFNGKLFASYYKPDVAIRGEIDVFDNSSWAATYVDPNAVPTPYVGLFADEVYMYAFANCVPATAGTNKRILRSTNGAAWTDISANFTNTTSLATGTPVFGAINL